MRITRFTDLALRLLAHLASHQGERSAVAGIARAHGLSAAHLEKVASELARLGLIAATRGRNGGLRLARAPEAIGVGAVVRALESEEVAGCDECAERADCKLPGILCQAYAAFYAALDRYTIVDLLLVPDVDAARAEPRDLRRLVRHIEDRQREVVA